MNRRAPQRRPTGWKPPRPKGELFRAVLAAMAVVVVTVLVILGLHELDSPGSTSPTPLVTTSSPGSAPPVSTSVSTPRASTPSASRP